MKLRRTYAAFTLIELLVVIGIIGLLAGLVGPTLTGFRQGDAMLAATRTMLDGVARARQLAISQHTTVYMVFVPPSFWADTAFSTSLSPFTPTPNLTQADLVAATNLVEKEFTGFTFVTLRTLADQPGQGTPHYLSGWQSLPDKAFIATNKFRYSQFPAFYYTIFTSGVTGYDIYGFNVTTNVPFPRESTKAYTAARPYPSLPYIAFNYLGQLTTEALSPSPLQLDEYIPLAHGSVSVAHDSVTKKPIFNPPDAKEDPAGNSTNTAYNVIHIDWLTGRARAERQKVK